MNANVWSPLVRPTAKALLVATAVLLVALPLGLGAMGVESGVILAQAVPRYAAFAVLALLGAALGLSGQRTGALGLGVVLLAVAVVLFSNSFVPMALAALLVLGAALPLRRDAAA